MLKLLRERFEKQVKALYGIYPDSLPSGPSTMHYRKGIHLDPESATSPPGRPSTIFSDTTCNIVGNKVFDIPEEISTYQVPGASGQSCGSPIRMEVDLKIKVEKKGLGCDMYAICITDLEPKSNLILTGANGGRENAYLQGAYVSALSCFYKAKTTEIQRTKALQLEDINGVESECLAKAEYYKNITKDAGKVYGDFMKAFEEKGGNKGQYADIENCTHDWNNENSTVADPKIASLRQQAQQLCASRFAIESAFTRLAECQIFALSKAAWLNVIAANLPKYWTETIQDKVATPCAKFCADYMKSVFPGAESVINKGSFTSKVSKMGAAWACTKCKLFGNDCNQSGQCPVKTPTNYESARDFQSSYGAETKMRANDDVTQCTNECYKRGVQGGAIVGGAKARWANTPFAAPGSSANIPNYETAIQEYLKSKWPANPTQMGDCAQ